VPPDGGLRWTDGRNRALKVRRRAADLRGRAAHGRAAVEHKGFAEMKFRIYQHALTALLVTYTLVHTFGAKWG
jgi:hypothetical protein